MYKIAITENTHYSLESNELFLFLLEIENLRFDKNGTEYIMSFEVNVNNVDTIYQLISLIYDVKPNENNRWIFNNKEYLLSDEQAVKFFLLPFEDDNNYPLRKDILSDIIRNRKIRSIQELRNLAYKPFSGILFFNEFDMLRITGRRFENVFSECIKIEHSDICIKNRYIVNDFELRKGEFNFRNCIFEGNISISGSARIFFSQCIITGNVTCTDVSRAYFSSTNIKQLMLYNCNLDILCIDYCKVYRFVLHSCSLSELSLYSNKFIEPYIANLNIKDKKIKIDMSQFIKKNINERMIKNISKDKTIKVKNEGKFYLTFMFNKPITPVMSNEIAYDMINTLLDYGNLDKEHELYSNMKYKKALYSNTNWRRVFVFFTGAFYIPNRWILYLVLSTVLFTLLYTSFPAIQFMSILTNELVKLNLWTALYYSFFQIIGSNPTMFTPIGVSQVLTTIQSLLNTMFIANFFASIIRKFLRDDI